MITITNNSSALQGIRTADGGLCYIRPGETRTCNPQDIDKVRRLAFLDIDAPDDLPPPPAALLDKFDHDGDGKPGGVRAPEKTDRLKELRAAYKAKTGKRPFAGWDEAELEKRMGDA
jgi:hypothetical protein